jgi:hypothetical protein
MEFAYCIMDMEVDPEAEGQEHLEMVGGKLVVVIQMSGGPSARIRPIAVRSALRPSSTPPT